MIDCSIERLINIVFEDIGGVSMCISQHQHLNLIPRGVLRVCVKDMQSRSGVTQNGAGLLWSGRELTTKWENNLGLSSCAVPRSAVVCIVAYFRRTELLPGVSEKSGID